MFVPQSRIGIFATNAPDAPHWTPNSCFVAFRRVWVHLAPFCYCMKLGAKWVQLVQLMQKFMPRSRFRISGKMSAPDPHHRTIDSYFGAFHSVWVHLGLLCYGSKLSAKHDELVQLMQKFMPRSRFVISQNNCTQSTP